MEAAYRVLKYLKGCPGKEILYKKYDHQRVVVTTYLDVDWADSLTDRRSKILFICLGLLRGVVRNNRWWLSPVQKMNFGLWLMGSVNFYG